MSNGETGGHAPNLAREDPEIMRALEVELERERGYLNLIASENYASLAVLEAQGSILTNKYAEGYPEKRYYSGCEAVDLAERLAITRALELFGCDHANVQPHSGSQANMAAYMCALDPGDTLMAMDLACGGHLTHGSPANFSGTFYRAVHYGVDRETEIIDYQQVDDIAHRERPKLIVAGASSYPRTLDFAAFREIADSVGAALMVDMAHFAGLVVGGVHPDPVPYCHYVTGTTHKTLRGARGGFILTKAEVCEGIDRIVFPGVQGGPLMHAIAAKAVCFAEAMRPEFKLYARDIVANARALADVLTSEGFRIVSGGTDTHLLLIDLRPMGISGREAQDVLVSVGINANMNEIPYDPAPASVTSGLRLGTPAATTRGLREEEMRQLGGLISTALNRRDDPNALDTVKNEVRQMLDRFAIYPEL